VKASGCMALSYGAGCSSVTYFDDLTQLIEHRLIEADPLISWAATFPWFKELSGFEIDHPCHGLHSHTGALLEFLCDELDLLLGSAVENGEGNPGLRHILLAVIGPAAEFEMRALKNVGGVGIEGCE